mmetsp:Transcript_54270/g.118828  ORF Transcript_54270/g.118828 Transcript_54270/m.118828 type:complete len:81 (-) Transcript_54270:1062-1304(-)
MQIMIKVYMPSIGVGEIAMKANNEYQVTNFEISWLGFFPTFASCSWAGYLRQIDGTICSQTELHLPTPNQLSLTPLLCKT